MSGPEPTVEEYITALKNADRFGPQIAAHRPLLPVKGDFAAFPDSLPKNLVAALQKKGINRLYSHQAAAIKSIQADNNTLVATPTASGKSLIYNLPVFSNLADNTSDKALYLFPLKALAQDQLKTITELAESTTEFFANGLLQPAAIYDGDTTSYKRKKIREQPPAILITNPDMLHLSILAYHHLWGHFFAGLRYIIIDEVHTYRGVFGSHMAWVLRRLRRICKLYGSDPVFVLSSATIGNPLELAEKLIDEKVTVITRSGAPQPQRNFILLSPIDNPASTATLLLQAACSRQLRTIVYTQSRKMTELITMWSERRLGEDKAKIASYRAGFLPEERRTIEEKLSNGKLLGVISTSALELGIDIGSLDICILLGYPGSMMATWQRAGRVGRSGRESLVILIAQEDALDQYFVRNPDDFFTRPVEPVVVNPENPYIASDHIFCAAAEIPLERDDKLLENASLRTLIDNLTEQGKLMRSADGNTWFSARRTPQRNVGLRGSGQQFTIRLQTGRSLLGEIDGGRVFKDCHPGAIYLHRARPYHVESLDLEAREVIVSPAPPTYFTRVESNKDTEILSTEQSIRYKQTSVHLGMLKVTEVITGYWKLLAANRKVIGKSELNLPPQIMETQGLWLEIQPEVQHAVEKKMLHFMGGIHALEHAMIGMMPLTVLCDRNDIGGISHPYHEQTESPAVFIYDGYSGGMGLCSRAFTKIDVLLEQTFDAIANCPCDLGCPSCVHSPKCGSGNRPIDKEAACLILQHLLSGGDDKKTLNSAAQRKKTGRQQKKKTDKNIVLPHYGVFDIETRRSAQEVGGWHRADRMGVSVAVLYDSRLDTFLSFEEEEIEQLLDHLFELELVVGFNNKRFDNKVLSGYSSRSIGDLPSLDILEEIYKRLGYRLSLDRLAEHTLGKKKSADGLQALRWFKQGRMDLLTEYCRKDVAITRDLFLHGLAKEHLLFQNKAGKTVRLPVDFPAAITKLIKC